MHQNVHIAFFGNSEFSRIVLQELKKLGILPEIIVTTEDKPVGRKLILTPTPTKLWAEEHGIPCLEPTSLKDPVFQKQLASCNLFLVAAYGKIIPKEIIAMPEYHVLNIHPSLLPQYRGPSPLQTQILNDEKNIGVSIMLIDELVDHGPVVVQKSVPINDWPIGFQSLQKTLAQAGADAFAGILPQWIKGTLIARAQQHDQATFTKKIEKSDGCIDLDKDAYQNYLKILAYEDWPRAYFEIEKDHRTKKIIVTKASWKNSALLIERVIPEGKKEMPYEAFLRGSAQ